MERVPISKSCFTLSISVLPVLVLLIAGCGGGGSGSGSSGAKRTTDTALRVIHASLDSGPVSVSSVASEQVFLQKASFAEVTEYVPVDSGTTKILAEPGNPWETVRQLSNILQPETEYTLFLCGEARTGNSSVVLLEEPVVRPEEGKARIQLLNSLSGSEPLTLTGIGFSTAAAQYGRASGYFDTTAGPQTVQIFEGSHLVASVAVDLLDRGDATVLIAGAVDLGVVITRVYPDLD